MSSGSAGSHCDSVDGTHGRRDTERCSAPADGDVVDIRPAPAGGARARDSAQAVESPASSFGLGVDGSDASVPLRPLSKLRLPSTASIVYDLIVPLARGCAGIASVATLLKEVLEFLLFKPNVKGGASQWRKQVLAMRAKLQAIPDGHTRAIATALVQRSRTSFVAKTSSSWRPHWYLIAGVLGADPDWIVGLGGEKGGKQNLKETLLARMEAETWWLARTGPWLPPLRAITKMHALPRPSPSKRVDGAAAAPDDGDSSPVPGCVCCDGNGFCTDSKPAPAGAAPASAAPTGDVPATAAPAGAAPANVAPTVFATTRIGQLPAPASPWLSAKRQRQSSESASPETDMTTDEEAMAQADDVTMAQAYEILGTDATSTDEAVRLAYRQAILEAHPDKGGTPARFCAVREAWALISGSW